MAYIYKREKTYTYSVEAGRDAKGKRRKITKGGFKTKKEAQQAAAKIETKIATGTFIFESNISAADFADEWYIEHAKKIKISSSHNELYQKNIFKNYFGEKPMKNITRRNFQEFTDDITSRISNKGRPYSRATLSSIMKLAKKIFQSAMEQDLIAKNPTEFVHLPREKEKIGEEEALPKYLEKDQLQQVLDYTKKNLLFPYMYPIIMTLTYTGCRISEATALQWEDIDFTEKTIRINKDIFFTNELRREYVFQTPKTKKSNRTLKVSNTLLSALQEYKRWQNEDKMLHRDQYQENTFVFTGKCKDPLRPYGAPLPNSRIQNFMYNASKKIGIDIHPHMLRHTHASLLAEAGTGLEIILDRLGHADDKTTRMIYLHTTKKLKKEAVQKFDELMNS